MAQIHKIIIITVLQFTFCVSLLNAQENADKSLQMNASIDIASRFVWRGVALNRSVSFQPYLSLSKGGFSLMGWGSYTFAHEDYQTANIIASYKYKNVTITVADYFAPSDTTQARHSYFNYSGTDSKHLYDAYITIDGGPNLPFSILFSTFFYGNDKKPDGKTNNYSSYGELSYMGQLKSVDYTAFAGITLSEGFYGPIAGFVNIGIAMSKKIEITDKTKIPVKVTFSTNPVNKNIFVVAVLTL